VGKRLHCVLQPLQEHRCKGGGEAFVTISSGCLKVVEKLEVEISQEDFDLFGRLATFSALRVLGKQCDAVKVSI
jgi:hypothetical protein